MRGYNIEGGDRTRLSEILDLIEGETRSASPRPSPSYGHMVGDH
jgi:hypothetical protein